MISFFTHQELNSDQLIYNNVQNNVFTHNNHQLLVLCFAKSVCHWPINPSWRWVSFNSKLLSNSMSGLLPPALVCPLTGPAVWPVIYVYDHLVGPGCHFQQDGNLLINALSAGFTPQPGFIQTKTIKQYDCVFQAAQCFISFF